MKTFILKMVTFFLIGGACIAFLLVSVLVANVIFPKNCSLRPDTKTIIMGDSRIMWSIDDHNLPSVQNVALNAEGYIYTYAKLKYLLNHGAAFTIMYLGFSYPNLSGYYDDWIFGTIALDYVGRYIPILGIEEYVALISNNPKNIIVMVPPLLKKGLYNLLNKKCTFLGSFPQEKKTQTFKRKNTEMRILQQYYRNDTIVSCSRINLEYLTKILDLCKKKNIRVIGLNTTVHPYYRKLIPDFYLQKLEQVAREFNLPVYDFPGLTMEDSCFLPDGDHVNYNGAMAMTRHFREYLEKEKQK